MNNEEKEYISYMKNKIRPAYRKKKDLLSYEMISEYIRHSCLGISDIHKMVLELERKNEIEIRKLIKCPECKHICYNLSISNTKREEKMYEKELEQNEGQIECGFCEEYFDPEEEVEEIYVIKDS